MMDNDPNSLAGSEPGQIQKLRQFATGSFPDTAAGDGEGSGDDLLARQPAEHADAAAGKFRPRDHGAVQPRHRQLHRAGRLRRGARVHRLQLADRRRSRQHDRELLHLSCTGRPITTPTAKEFTFAIYPDGGKIIPARAAAQRRTGRRSTSSSRWRRIRRRHDGWRRASTSSSSTRPRSPIRRSSPRWRIRILGTTTTSRRCCARSFNSQQFRDPANFFQRYSWPAEFVVRAIKETGWNGFSVNTAITPLTNMGQQLYEPPDVNGWELGPGWISTSSMLSRMNFASTLAANQRFNLARDAQPYRADARTRARIHRWRGSGRWALRRRRSTSMTEYLRSTAWTGADAQLQQRVPGLTRLIVGSGEYQFN